MRIFGGAAVFHDVATDADLADVRHSLADLPWVEGPLHVNVQLSPPLVPEDRWQATATTLESPFVRKGRKAPHQLELATGPRTVVVAGDDAGPRARVLAQAGGWPLLAEPTSGSRTGDNPIRCYRLLLDSDLGRRVERVVVAGHPTLSRPVTRLLEREDVEVVSVRPRGTLGRAPVPGGPHGRGGPGGHQ